MLSKPSTWMSCGRTSVAFTSTPTKCFHRRGVLGAIQTLDRHMARLRTFGMGVEGVLHPGDERIDILLRRLRTARRRHQMSAQFAQRFLPDLRVIRGGLEVQAVQREAAGLRARVVAADAVGVQHRAMWIRRGSPQASAPPLGSAKPPERRSEPPQHSRKGNASYIATHRLINDLQSDVHHLFYHKKLDCNRGGNGRNARPSRCCSICSNPCRGATQARVEDSTLALRRTGKSHACGFESMMVIRSRQRRPRV